MGISGDLVKQQKRLNRMARLVLIAGVLVCTGCPPENAAPVERRPAVRPIAVTLAVETVPIDSAAATDRFVDRAWSATRHDADLAYLAIQHATSADVHRFARQLLDDEAIIRGDLAEPASQVGSATPFVVEPEQQESTIRLSNLTGSNFDRAYMETALRDQARTATVYEHAAAEHPDPAAREAAVRALPIIRKHLRMARETAARVGVVLASELPDDSPKARSLEILRPGPK